MIEDVHSIGLISSRHAPAIGVSCDLSNYFVEMVIDKTDRYKMLTS